MKKEGGGQELHDFFGGRDAWMDGIREGSWWGAVGKMRSSGILGWYISKGVVM